jgi:Flp pilus assembly protein TadD
MMRGLLHLRVLGALLACGAAVAAAAPAIAQGSYSPYAESPAAALARYVRALASDPKDFSSLIGAGKAALEMGDNQAAAGFFARADEVNPRSPLPQAGMGAVSVANGEPQGALPYFTRALQLGAPVAIFGSDRGLAYDLLGRQRDAQSDYRAALGGPESEEARRRLALSLAISGDKTGALEALAPLMAKGDAAAARARAFVCALTGDSNGAMVAIDAAMPGSWVRVQPFLTKLPTLLPAQKAAAVNLGIFPDAGDAAYAYSAPTANYATPAQTTAQVASDRPSGLDDFLKPGTPALAPSQPAQAPSWQGAQAAVQLAYSAPVRAPSPPRQSASGSPPGKIWLQLASGANASALPSQFRRIKTHNSALMDGIKGYIANSPDRSRLVIGPFRGTSDAQIFADDLESVGVNAFRWTNSQADQIVPLATE